MALSPSLVTLDPGSTSLLVAPKRNESSSKSSLRRLTVAVGGLLPAPGWPLVLLSSGELGLEAGGSPWRRLAAVRDLVCG